MSGLGNKEIMAKNIQYYMDCLLYTSETEYFGVTIEELLK